MTNDYVYKMSNEQDATVNLLHELISINDDEVATLIAEICTCRWWQAVAYVYTFDAFVVLFIFPFISLFILCAMLYVNCFIIILCKLYE